MSLDMGKRCRHYNGIHNNTCEVGIVYPKERGCCWGKGVCQKYNPLTATEFEAKQREDEKADKHFEDCLRRKISTCCEAPLDESQVITGGRHKGHGPRFCSKCGRCCFMV